MATRGIVPRANNEGHIGTQAKQWEHGYFKNLWVDGEPAGTQAAIIAANPVYYERSSLMSPNHVFLTMPEMMSVNIGGKGYVLRNSPVYDLADSTAWDTQSPTDYTVANNRKGKDFYVYACQPASGNAPVIKISANSTVPDGYTAANSRKIGGFHCLCSSVGTISGHALSGYVTGDILPRSVWDLKHRAVSENEGMVWCPEINKWVNIYLASWDGSGLASAYGATIADGASSPNFHGEKFAEYLGLVDKQLLWRDEFIVVAKGSNENTNINGSADPVTTGGHVDTASRRMISNYGLEDCCGALWQWARDCPEAMSTSYSSGNQYMGGYSWNEASVYHSGTDSQKYGSCNGLLRRLLLGGGWGDGSNCGSRSTHCRHFSACGGAADVAARGASEPRAV